MGREYLKLFPACTLKKEGVKLNKIDIRDNEKDYNFFLNDLKRRSEKKQKIMQFINDVKQNAEKIREYNNINTIKKLDQLFKGGI